MYLKKKLYINKIPFFPGSCGARHEESQDAGADP